MPFRKPKRKSSRSSQGTSKKTLPSVPLLHPCDHQKHLDTTQRTIANNSPSHLHKSHKLPECPSKSPQKVTPKASDRLPLCPLPLNHPHRTRAHELNVMKRSDMRIFGKRHGNFAGTLRVPGGFFSGTPADTCGIPSAILRVLRGSTAGIQRTKQTVKNIYFPETVLY